MPIRIINQDITKVCCDAIVDPTDFFYSGSGGTDLAIHTAAGPELAAECEKLPRLSFGEVHKSKAYALPCRYVLHTMGPIWHGGNDCEPVLLRSCYLNALVEARKLKLDSVAFPLISSGTFGFPKDKVLRIAVDAISDFLFTADAEMDVIICIRDKNAYELSREISLQEFIESNRSRPERENFSCKSKKIRVADSFPKLSMAGECPKASSIEPKSSLSDWLKKHDDSFAVTLLKLIDKKGMTDVECYKKANLTKGTFYKIRNDPKYRPSKQTVIAFAVALQLSLDETQKLLKTVGMTLSHTNTFDLIIEYYLLEGNYDIFEINDALYKYDQVILGSF